MSHEIWQGNPGDSFSIRKFVMIVNFYIEYLKVCTKIVPSFPLVIKVWVYVWCKNWLTNNIHALTCVMFVFPAGQERAECDPRGRGPHLQHLQTRAQVHPPAGRGTGCLRRNTGIMHPFHAAAGRGTGRLRRYTGIMPRGSCGSVMQPNTFKATASWLLGRWIRCTPEIALKKKMLVCIKKKFLKIYIF